MNSRYCFFIIVFNFWLISPNFGHGDLHERILLLSEKIVSNPDSASLYFERAKLYFYHKEFSLSIDDLNSSGKLGYEDPLKDLFYAKANQKLNNYNKTLKYTSKILAEDTANVNAIKIQAEVFFDQENYLQSANAYDNLINSSRRTLPENYLNASDAWRLCSSKIDQKKAIDILDRGMEELGELPVFLTRKKEYFIQDNQMQKALDVQKTIIHSSQRKEKKYLEAAEIAMMMGNTEQANVYLKEAENAFNKLPPRLKSNKAMKELFASIQNTKILLSNKH